MISAQVAPVMIHLDVHALASGIMDGMVMAAIETKFVEISEFRLPPPGAIVEAHLPVSSEQNFSVALTVLNDSVTSPEEIFITCERRTRRALTAQQRYEVLERLADLVMVEAALAKKDASE